MKFLGNLLTALFALAALALGVYEMLNPPKEEEEAEGAEEHTVNVNVIALKKDKRTPVVVAYGEILGSAGAIVEVTMPFEVKVKRLYVAAGQAVNKGDLLIDVAPTAEVTLALTQAKSALSAAQKELESVNQRLALHLATNSEKNAAEAAVITAKQEYDNLASRGGGPRTLKAEASGVIGQDLVNERAFVAAGSPLLSIFDASHIEARLGVAPEEAASLSAGQMVMITAVQGGADPIQGSLRSVGRALNPVTRLVDVYVSLPGNAVSILMGSLVRGEFQETPIEGFPVPRSAVLPNDDSLSQAGDFKIFVLDGDTAKEQAVKILYQQGDEVLLDPSGLTEGVEIVIEGNYELSDGDKAEKIEPTSEEEKENSPKSEPTSKPSSQEVAPKEEK